MPRRFRYTPSGRTTLIGLFALALIFMLLPSSWTGGLMSLVQVLAPFQAVSSSAGDAVTNLAEHPAEPPTAEVHAQMQQRQLALQNQVAALSAYVETLEQENELLTAIRLQNLGAVPLGAKGRLIPARVIAQDAVTWRSSKLIDAGTLRGVRRGDAVTSHAFDVSRGSEEGVRDGLAVLLAESLVGVVERTGTHTARVKLLSDVTTQRRVRVGRFAEHEFVLAGPEFWLVGKGHGKMEIRDVDRRLEQDGTVQVGDLVLSDPTDTLLPSALTIGVVTSIEPDRDNPLLRIMTVEPRVRERRLQQVYVYDPAREVD